MKYALIGCGRIATNHMKAAINNKLEIVAVCDVLPEKMEALLAKHDLQEDISIKRYEDYKQMVAEEKPDLVSIATESGIHAEIALYCIEQGINLVIEKPMARVLKMQIKSLIFQRKRALRFQHAIRTGSMLQFKN